MILIINVKKDRASESVTFVGLILFVSKISPSKFVFIMDYFHSYKCQVKIKETLARL